jgi:hypothetical protein
LPLSGPFPLAPLVLFVFFNANSLFAFSVRLLVSRCATRGHWDILPFFHELRQSYGSYWGTGVKESSVEELLEEVYRQMRLFGLLRGPDAERRFLILPTAARYSVTYQQDQPEKRSQAPTRTRKKKQPNVAVSLEFTWDSPLQNENEEE